jgi:hypothetical protein
MDLIRDLLIGISDDKIDDQQFDGDRMLYHFELLIQTGYLEGMTILRGADGGISRALHSPRLTWNGNEFLDTIRKKSVWEKIKKFTNDKGVELTIDAIKMAAPTVIGAMLGSK